MGKTRNPSAVALPTSKKNCRSSGHSAAPRPPATRQQPASNPMPAYHNGECKNAVSQRHARMIILFVAYRR
jgi:hypothetical protein